MHWYFACMYLWVRVQILKLQRFFSCHVGARN